LVIKACFDPSLHLHGLLLISCVTSHTCIDLSFPFATLGEALEVASLLSVKAQDDAGFERFFAQLRPYYFDYGLAESSRTNLILGLYLMYLLTQAKIGDFHTQLELLTPKQRSHAMIKFSVDLERDMNEGLYNRVWNACNKLPDPAFGHFANSLTDAVRHDIAKCLEVAYEHLQVQDAMKLLRFTTQDSAASFTEFATHEDRAWNVAEGIVTFKKGEQHDLDLGAETLINQSLAYAHEIERII
jgi:26S proteasome regulatory subunit N12